MRKYRIRETSLFKKSEIKTLTRVVGDNVPYQEKDKTSRSNGWNLTRSWFKKERSCKIKQFRDNWKILIRDCILSGIKKPMLISLVWYCGCIRECPYSYNEHNEVFRMKHHLYNLHSNVYICTHSYLKSIHTYVNNYSVYFPFNFSILKIFIIKSWGKKYNYTFAHNSYLHLHRCFIWFR